MRYLTLACDYDGTIARHGVVDDPTVAALARVRETGRRLILVTGRQLDDLTRVFPHVHLFDRVVAENGALLYSPATRAEQPLGERPPEAFVQALRTRNVNPLSVGRVIVATWEPNEAAVFEVIRDLGLELQVIFNKGAVMVLPSGINKASGLQAALRDLGLSPHNAVGVGDAENDHAFLSLCECSIAVANALPMLKQRADWVTRGDHGAGVAELIDALIATDLRDLEPRLQRPHILLGTRDDGVERHSHQRKYAGGELDEDRSFYFRGPEKKLNLRAQNLVLFMQLADGVDDATWLYHLDQGDYSRWFSEVIKDQDLAAEAARIEAQANRDPAASRAHIRAAIEQRYTQAA